MTSEPKPRVVIPPSPSVRLFKKGQSHDFGVPEFLVTVFIYFVSLVPLHKVIKVLVVVVAVVLGLKSGSDLGGSAQ